MNFIDKLRQVLFGEGAPPSPALRPPAAPAIPPVRVDYDDKRVPPPAQERIKRILSSLAEVDAALKRETPPGFSRLDIEQMRDQHLPKLVKSYIDVPPAHRAEIFRKTGKSASFILNECLDQMQAKIDDILRSLAQNDIDAFTNSTRFIEQRYADHDPFG